MQWFTRQAISEVVTHGMQFVWRERPYVSDTNDVWLCVSLKIEYLDVDDRDDLENIDDHY